jgi:hypothetical protein
MFAQRISEREWGIFLQRVAVYEPGLPAMSPGEAEVYTRIRWKYRW